MDQLSHEVRLKQWHEIIQNQLASGQSKREWCKENAIPEKQFFYWQRRVRKELYESQTQALEPVRAPAASTGFIEVAIAERTNSVISAGFHPEAVISVGNVTVGVTASISEDLLMRIGKMIRHAL